MLRIQQLPPVGSCRRTRRGSSSGRAPWNQGMHGRGAPLEGNRTGPPPLPRERYSRSRVRRQLHRKEAYWLGQKSAGTASRLPNRRPPPKPAATSSSPRPPPPPLIRRLPWDGSGTFRDHPWASSPWSRPGRGRRPLPVLPCPPGPGYPDADPLVGALGASVAGGQRNPVAGRGQGHQRIMDGASCGPEPAQRLGRPAGIARQKAKPRPWGSSAPRRAGRSGPRGSPPANVPPGPAPFCPTSQPPQVGGMGPHQPGHPWCRWRMSPPVLVHPPENGRVVDPGPAGRDPDLSLLDQPGGA